MKLANKNNIKITKKDLAQFMSINYCIPYADVEDFISKYEETVLGVLANTNVDTDVSIKLFDGFFLHSKCIPKHTKINNLTGQVIDTQEKIKVVGKQTRKFPDIIRKKMRILNMV